MNETQAGLVALGLTMIFGPRIGSAVAGFFGRPSAPAEPGKFDRSRAVSTLLVMEDEFASAGLGRAAELTGSLLVELVSPSAGRPAEPSQKKAGR